MSAKHGVENLHESDQASNKHGQAEDKQNDAKSDIVPAQSLFAKECQKIRIACIVNLFENTGDVGVSAILEM